MKSKNKGFTLIELIAVMAIMGIVITGIYSVMDSGNALYKNGIRIDNTETNGRQCMEFLSQKIKTCKTYVDTTGMAGSRFDSVKVNGNPIANTDRIAYVEAYDNNRYMYIIESNNGIKELHQLTFNQQGRNQYSIKSPLISEEITPTDEQAYNLDSQSKVEYKTGDLEQVELNKLGPGYIPKWFLYENYGEACYLWVENGANKIKVELEKKDNEDFTIKNNATIGEYIYSITVTKEDALEKTSKIYIKVKDGGKEKEITTSVFILNGRD